MADVPSTHVILVLVARCGCCTNVAKGSRGSRGVVRGEIGGHGAQGTAVAQKGIGRYSAFHMGRVVVAFRGEGLRGGAQSVARADVQNRRNG